MKVYLAGRYPRRDELREYAKLFEAAGIQVTSRWLQENEALSSQMGDHTEDFYKQTAQIDLEDVYDADVVVFFSEDPKVPHVRGGRHVEFGYALGMGKGIAVIGPKENVFHYIEGVKHFTTVEEAVADLKWKDRLFRIKHAAEWMKMPEFAKFMREIDATN